MASFNSHKTTAVNSLKLIQLILFSLLCGFIMGLLSPNEIEAQKATLVIENARVLIGNGEIKEHASVVISGDHIKSVTQEPVQGTDISRIDASGETVLPGLIDAHVHLGPGPYRDSAKVYSYLNGPVYDVLQTFLNNGVTTVRSTGGHWPMEKHLREKLTQGVVSGPRLITSGPIFTMKGAHPATTICAPENDFCRSTLAREVTKPEQARKAVHKLAEEGVDFIKLVSDTINHQVPYPPDSLIKAIIEQGHQDGLKVVGHVASHKDMISYVHMGMDGFVHPPLEPVSRHHTQKLGELFSRKEIPVTTTLSPSLFFHPTDSVLSGKGPVYKALEQQSEHMLELTRDGVMIVAGTDWRTGSDHPALQPGAMMITEMKMLRWGGMSQKHIIKTATANAARALEMGDQIGTLESGKLADVIIVNGNPLQDITALKNISTVIKGGKVINPR